MITKSLKDALHDWAGVDLTDAQLEELMADPILLRELLLCGDHVDTLAREVAMSLLAKKIVGRRWPTYGDKDTSFHEEFRQAAAAKGYRLV